VFSVHPAPQEVLAPLRLAQALFSPDEDQLAFVLPLDLAQLQLRFARVLPR
jgi:hypothetical protein